MNAEIKQLKKDFEAMKEDYQGGVHAPLVDILASQDTIKKNQLKITRRVSKLEKSQIEYKSILESQTTHLSAIQDTGLKQLEVNQKIHLSLDNYQEKVNQIPNIKEKVESHDKDIAIFVKMKNFVQIGTRWGVWLLLIFFLAGMISVKILDIKIIEFIKEII